MLFVFPTLKNPNKLQKSNKSSHIRGLLLLDHFVLKTIKKETQNDYIKYKLYENLNLKSKSNITHPDIWAVFARCT